MVFEGLQTVKSIRMLFKRHGSCKAIIVLFPVDLFPRTPVVSALYQLLISGKDTLAKHEYLWKTSSLCIICIFFLINVNFKSFKKFKLSLN